eukprot:4896553-Amphidinium_carterae.1
MRASVGSKPYHLNCSKADTSFVVGVSTHIFQKPMSTATADIARSEGGNIVALADRRKCPDMTVTAAVSAMAFTSPVYLECEAFAP